MKGGIPDKVSAARQVLKDWNSGRIPYYTLPPKDSAPEKSNDATVVSSFSKEFDLSQFDDAVIQSLEDKDEMDFVQLDEVQKDDEMVNDAKWKEASDFIMRENDSDDSKSIASDDDEEGMDEA